MRRRERAQRATRICANRRAVIGSARRTSWQAARGIHFDIGREVIGEVNGVAGGFMLLQRKLAFRRIDLAEIVDAAIGLRSGTGFHEVRNRNCRQQTDDGHDNHDFHQCETSFTDLDLFFYLFFLFIFLFISSNEPKECLLLHNLDTTQATTHSLNLTSTTDAKIYCNWCDGVSVLNVQLADGMDPTKFNEYVPPEGHGGIEPLVVNLR